MQRLFPHFNVLVTLSVAGLAFSMCGWVAQADQPQPPGEPTESVLILRNGHVLVGEITRSDDRFNVSVEGGRISVSVADTELLCRNLEEAYEHKRLALGSLDVHGHLELAGWCQRQGLMELAGRELLEAKKLSPSHPMIPVIERRIQMSLAPPKPVEPVKVAAVSVRPPLSPDELDHIARDMPPGTMETFVRSIQPLLVNRCGAARCHGPVSDNQLHLLRPPPSSRPSRRTTQRNLHAVLKLIDRNDPTRSPLLTSALKPHGDLDVPVFAGRRADQYERVANWVHQVARGPSNVVQVAHEEPIGGHDEQAVPTLQTTRVTGLPSDRPVKSIADTPPEDLDRDLQNAFGLPNEGYDTQSINPGTRVKRGAIHPSFTPIDPFDPQIFNRRFHPRVSQDSSPLDSL